MIVSAFFNVFLADFLAYKHHSFALILMAFRSAYFLSVRDVKDNDRYFLLYDLELNSTGYFYLFSEVLLLVQQSLHVHSL